METKQLDIPAKYTCVWLQLRFQAFGDSSFRTGNHLSFSPISLQVFMHQSAPAHIQTQYNVGNTFLFSKKILPLPKAVTPTRSLLPSPVTHKATLSKLAPRYHSPFQLICIPTASLYIPAAHTQPCSLAVLQHSLRNCVIDSKEISDGRSPPLKSI